MDWPKRGIVYARSLNFRISSVDSLDCCWGTQPFTFALRPQVAVELELGHTRETIGDNIAVGVGIRLLLLLLYDFVESG